MRAIDWILLIAPLAVVFPFAIYTNRYVRSVADFLSGGRCAGRYLLANAKGETDSGLSSGMSVFEMFLISGFVLNFWDRISYPIMLLVAISGFVVYRFRETRALTLAQFLEARYSRNFRLFMGVMAFVAGVLNYGIFPAISARFFIYFLDLPLTMHLGPITISTFSLIMGAYLSCAVFLVLAGGQATMMVICCIEGLLSQLLYVAVAATVLYIVRWHRIVDVMNVQPHDHSMVNPFDAAGVKDFNLYFILISVFTRIYTTMAMQHRQGFNSAALTPHESRMGGVLGEWRSYARVLMLLVLSICALTYVHHPFFAAQADPIHKAIASVNDTYLESQLTVPIALRYMLPPGVKGLFCAVMVMGLFSADGSHLHSWGSIFVQDIILPHRKNALSPRHHIWLLRAGVSGVAVLAFLFSTYFTQTQAIQLWMQLTGAVFTSGAGAAIIGGLYWKKGTTPAAWAGATIGSFLALTGILIGSYWPRFAAWSGPTLSHVGIHLPMQFWFNNQVSAFIALCAAAAIYGVISLLTSRQDFNLERMLHRGKYAVAADGPKPQSLREKITLSSILRFDENFTLGDKIISAGLFWLSTGIMVVNIVIAVVSLSFHQLSNNWWTSYWLILAIIAPFVISAVTLVWFTIGGIHDLRAFFHALKTVKRDARDDGRVVAHHNLADEPVADAKPKLPATV